MATENNKEANPQTKLVQQYIDQSGVHMVFPFDWTKEEKWALNQFRDILGQLDLVVDAIEKGAHVSEDLPSPISSPHIQDSSSSNTSKDVSSPKVPKYLLVRFLDSLQSIAGLDLRPYGPFHPEDIVTLPVEIARPLIQQNIVVEQRKGRL